jgi:hypothetical protein
MVLIGQRLCVAAFLGCLYALFGGTARAEPAEIGMDRSNLTRLSEAEQEKTLRNIHDLGAIWFRDGFASATPDAIAKFVNEIKLVKQNQLKFLAIVSPTSTDYDPGYTGTNAGDDFRKICGWSGGSPQLSKINLTNLTQRLRTQLAAVKAANLTIDAFEIGNEEDWICYNGDVPNGHKASDAELLTAVRGYANFLKAAATVIHDPHYFPQAKIITFGIAHSSDRWDVPPHHFSNPAHMVAMLKNLDGFNYLDNPGYHVDGYGTHIYPWDANNLESSIDLVRQDAAALGSLLSPDKPFWVTEWGLGAKMYPNKKGESRGDGIKDFYAVMAKTRIPFGPTFYYAYDFLVDANGALLPAASAVATPKAGK